MKAQTSRFNTILESIYSLTLEDREELIDLLEHNIVETRRTEIATNLKKSKAEHKSGQLKFSSNMTTLKKML